MYISYHIDIYFIFLVTKAALGMCMSWSCPKVTISSYTSFFRFLAQGLAIYGLMAKHSPLPASVWPTKEKNGFYISKWFGWKMNQKKNTP